MYVARAYFLKVFGIALSSGTNYAMMQMVINFSLSIWTLCEKDLKENTILYAHANIHMYTAFNLLPEKA